MANKPSTPNRALLWTGLIASSIAVILGFTWFFLAYNSPEEDNAQISTLSTLNHVAQLSKIFTGEKEISTLILWQNDTELRAGGGFITAVGTATISNGHINNLEIQPGRFYGIEPDLQVPVPEPIDRFITSDFLTLRDANLSPDFPTSATNVLRFYENATNLKPQLVIAVNTSVNEKLVEKVGPITFTVNGHTLTLDASNVTEELERLTDLDFAELGLTEENRKIILTEYATAFLPKVQALIKEEPLQTLSLAQQLLKNYDLQLWSTDPEIQKHLTALHTSQIVDELTTDGLLIVDTNLASRKTDPFIKQGAQYQVDLESKEATLTLTYKNTAVEGPLTTTYNDYVSLYTPLNTQLISTEGLTDVKEANLNSRSVFSGLFSVEPGKSQTITFKYQLPDYFYSQAADTFELVYERQSGARLFPINYIIYVDDSESNIKFDSGRDQTITIDNPSIVR